MSFHERSAWACLLSIVLVYVPYFALAFRHPLAYVGLFVLAVILQVVLLTAFHIVNAIVTPSIRQSGDVPAQDELDQKIELHAARLAGLVLGVAVVLWCLIAMFGAPAVGAHELALATANDETAASPSQFAIPMNDALVAIHALFAGFVIANCVYYGSIVVSYRRLAHG